MFLWKEDQVVHSEGVIQVFVPFVGIFLWGSVARDPAVDVYYPLVTLRSVFHGRVVLIVDISFDLRNATFTTWVAVSRRR